jgi:hypothetical protein
VKEKAASLRNAAFLAFGKLSKLKGFSRIKYRNFFIRP